MNNVEKACVAALAPHVRAVGLDIEPLHGVEALRVPELGLDIHAMEAQSNSTWVSVTFAARPCGDPAGGIRVLSLGLGDTSEAAVADAATQWALGVLPVLRSYILHRHVCEIELFPMVVGRTDSPGQFGWTVHAGPVVGRAFGKTGAAKPSLGDLSRFAAYEPLFHVLHAHAPHSKLMWVESFAARYYSDNKVDATCRLNNQDVQDGREALLAWANGWPPSGAESLSKRQFLILEPRALDEVDHSGKLRRHLDCATAERRQPWWKRLLRKGDPE
jgi:hypothetical protein